MALQLTTAVGAAMKAGRAGIELVGMRASGRARTATRSIVVGDIELC